jgi:type III secretory pathway component EscV
MGIVIPGVRVRDDQNSTTTFQIDLFEHKVAQGLVYLEMSFCNAAPWDLDELQVPKENYIPVIDTLFGHSGCWVDAA